MHLHPKLDQPPQWGAWLLGLFAEGDEGEQIVGDLEEEYLQHASQSGRASARRWYRRQVLGTLPHLLGSALRTSPWKIAVAVVFGFEFRRLMGHVPERAIFTLIDRTGVFETHYSVYQFLASTGIDIGHLITFLLVGILAALIARRRELAPALALGLIYAGMAVVASVWFVLKFHEFGYLVRLSWYFSDAFAVVVGAVIVRMLRFNRTGLAPQT